MTPRFTALPLAALATIAILVAACGGGTATAAPGATTTTGPTQAPATQGPGATGAEATFDLSSFHANTQLEDLFPDKIGTSDITVLSMSGDDFLGQGSSPELDAALTALHKQPSDLSVAFGVGSVDEAGFTIIAFQLAGVPGGTILTELFKAFQDENASTVTDVNISGKSVKKLVDTETQETNYVYTAQDVVFSATGEGITQATLNEIFSKLP